MTEDSTPGTDPDRGGSGDAGAGRSGGHGGWADGLRLAFGTLTVLPAPMPSRVDRVVAGRAMVLAPVVGVLLGVISAGVVALVQEVKPAPLLAAVVGVLVLVVLSGALHLDGLADFADALGSRRDRETMLRIMKQSDIGPFGVVAIIGVLLLDVAALTTCIQSGFGWQAILIATTASRLTLPWACHTNIPSARPNGLGATVAATVRPLIGVLTTIAVLAVTLVFTWFATRSSGRVVAGRDSVDVQLLAGTAAAVLVAVATGLLATRRARTALGGITGDTLGAAVELAFPTALLVLALTA